MTVAAAEAVGALKTDPVANPFEFPEQKPPAQVPPKEPLELPTTPVTTDPCCIKTHPWGNQIGCPF
jgi:hypothetical protein